MSTATSPLLETENDLRPRISVIGVGGAGGNAVNNMIRAQLEGVDFLIANTDAQAIEQSLVPKEKRIQLGLDVTQGLGAGSRPEVGRSSAEESHEEVMSHIRGSNMLFITAGMGGGTGTGAAPVIARAAREAGILTVGVVTKPFHFEGSHRTRTAEKGIEELQQYVDTLIVIPNQNLFRLANEHTTFSDAFKMADDVLYSGVRGVTDLMIMPGLINLDFADIRAVMAEMGKAMMGTGEAEGERRALDAAEAAINNPLLDDVSMKGAKGVLINITGGYDMTLYEVDEAANRIRDDIDSSANIIFGSTFDERMNGVIRVSVVATGIGTTEGSYSVSSQANFKQTDFNQLDTSHTNPVTTSQMFGNFTNQKPKTHQEDDTLNESLTENKDTLFDGKDDFFEDIVSNNSEAELPAKEQFENDETDVSSLSDDSDFADIMRTSHTDKYADDEKQHEKQLEKNLPSKKKSPGFFERFTGIGRRQQDEEITEDASLHATKRSFMSSSKTGNTPSQSDDDMLEIPAFLRRNSKD